MKQFSKRKSNDQLAVWVVVVLIIQDAKSMLTILFSPVFYQTLLHLFHLSSLTAQVCEMCYWAQNVCTCFLYFVLLKCFSFWEKFGELLLKICINLNKYISKQKFQFFWSYFKEIEFSGNTLEYYLILNLMKIFLVADQLFHAVGETWKR